MNKHNAALLDEFHQHLLATGKVKVTADNYVVKARAYLNHVGDVPLHRISEEVSKSFFARYKNPKTRATYTNSVKLFLEWAAIRVPVPVVMKPPTTDIALQQQWKLDKHDELLAKLGRKLIDHWLWFQGRLKGQPDNLDDIQRFAAEAEELIQRNLALFMQLSATGHNIHSKIDERAQR